MRQRWRSGSLRRSSGAITLGLAVLLTVTACSRTAAPPAAPAPQAPATVAQQHPAHIATDSQAADTALPPAPVLDSTFDRELLQELRLAADSAADEAALEQLAAAGDTAPTSDAALPEEAGASAVTFDINVAGYNSHDRVKYYLDFFQTTGRERFGIWLTRMPRYESMIRRRLQAEGLPSDLVYLALIESGFSNTATSRARAVGMWQFMKGTAKLYHLRIDRWVDERRDPYKATDAAVRHLKDLSEQFGSYYLAAAAYNAGSGKVSRGLNRLSDDESDSLATDAAFFRLYDTKFIRQETKDYVPKLIAAAMIAKDPTRYSFPAPPAPDTLAPYDSVIATDMTGLDVIARLADTTVATIRELNPQFLRLVTPPGSRSVVRLPVGRGAIAQAAYAELPASKRVNFREHLARRGETVRGIAKRYSVSADEIYASNPRLRGRGLRAGQLVVVPMRGVVSPDIARQLAAADEMTVDRTYHRVKRGETLGLIAGRYGVTQHQLVSWNHLPKSGLIRAGQKLLIMPSQVATRSVTRAKSAASKPTAKQAKSSRSSSRTHVVRRGETLTGLARRYGVTIQALKEANGLVQDATLRSGVRLRIPA
jgi:membrane-bound lytic murein transglycosylase D